MPSEESDSEKIGKRLFEQMRDIFVRAEIEKRRSEGRIDSTFRIHAIQVIFRMNGPHIVRFNEEIRAIAMAKINGIVEVGRIIDQRELENITEIELTEHDPNAGHVTMILLNDKWRISFDFRYNAKLVKEHIAAAREFVALADHALTLGHLRGFVDNLYSATELLAKAVLLSHHGKSLLTTKKHGTVSSAFNKWTRNRASDFRFSGLLNELYELRYPARYLSSPLNMETSKASEYLGTAKDLLEYAEYIAPKRRLTHD